MYHLMIHINILWIYCIICLIRNDHFWHLVFIILTSKELLPPEAQWSAQRRPHRHPKRPVRCGSVPLSGWARAGWGIREHFMLDMFFFLKHIYIYIKCIILYILSVLIMVGFIPGGYPWWLSHPQCHETSFSSWTQPVPTQSINLFIW
jgi:hypothetical protein